MNFIEGSRRKNFWQFCIGFGLVAAFGIVTSAQVQAQAIQLPSNRLFETSVSGKAVRCGQLNNGKWVPGALKRNGTTFTPHAALIKKLNKQLKTAPEDKKAKLSNKISKLKLKQRSGKSVCASGPGGGGTPSPTPGPGATPTPSGCFQGSQTSCFGIPSGIRGDVNRGSSLWSAMACQGCHTEASKRSMTFNRVAGAFSSQPTMFGLTVPTTEQTADLTAYLNRFNLP